MRGKEIFLSALLIGFVLFFTACMPGPEVYHVALKYDPAGVRHIPKIEERKHLVVAMFKDARPVDDPVKMGWVLHPGGKKRWVMPEEKYPDLAVTEAVSEYLRHRGFDVDRRHPRWDLKGDSIDEKWGNLVVGGAIEELEVTCDDADRFNPIKKYHARVRLRVVLADGKQKMVIYQTQTEATASLTDLSFSREKLEKQLNNALFEVIEKAFTGKEMTRLLSNL